MFDAIYARYSKRKDKPLDPRYKPKDSIRRRRLVNPRSDKLAVIFPGWHMHIFPLNYLIKRLQKKGWAVLVYDFNDQILEPNEEIVVQSFRYIRDTVAADLHDLKKNNHYKQIHFIGISLGSVPLTLVSDKFNAFTGATLVVAGDDLAIDMWHSIRTTTYKDAFRKMHVSMRRLDDEWKILVPINHVRHFAHKNIRIFMSLHDKFVLTQYQKNLTERILHTDAQVKIKKSRLGHALSIIRFCIFGKLM